MKGNPKAVVIFSGGMDSTVLLYDLKAHYDLTAISFNYGQRHRKELAYALKTTELLRIPHHVVPLHNLSQLLGGSALTDRSVPIPEGHYTSETMRSTIVPNRNAIMLSIAYGHAISIGAAFVATAVHAGDHAIYPDCRNEFIVRLENALKSGNDSDCGIWAPYVMRSKADICKLGVELNVPFQMTWSCYKGGDFHCGVCGTCVERREAFQLTGTVDPTIYRESNES